MSKIHVNAEGESKQCHAEQGGCPYGEERHFDNEKDAQAFAAQEMEEKYGDETSVNKSSRTKSSAKFTDFGDYPEGAMHEAKTGVPEYDNLSDDEKIEMDNAIAYINARDYASLNARRAMVVGNMYGDTLNTQYGILNSTNDPELTSLVRSQVRQRESMEDASRSVISATRGAFLTSEDSKAAGLSKPYKDLNSMKPETVTALTGGRYRMDWNSEVKQLNNQINQVEDAERRFNANADALEPHRKRFEDNSRNSESGFEKLHWEKQARSVKKAQEEYREHAENAKNTARQYKRRLGVAEKNAKGMKSNKGFDQFGTRMNSVNSENRTGYSSNVEPLSMSSAKDKEETAKKLSKWREDQKNASPVAEGDMSGHLTEIGSRNEVDNRVSDMVRNDGYIVTRQGDRIGEGYVNYVENRLAMEKLDPKRDSKKYQEHKRKFEQARDWVRQEDARVRLGLTYEEVDKHNKMSFS